MKKLLLLLACFVSLQLTACADRPITFEQLPAKSQEIIKQHFAGFEISFAKKDNDGLEVDYEVIFVNGDKIEFNRNGDWKNIECRFSQVPEALIPVQILEYVKSKYPNNKILKIELDHFNTEIELDNRLEYTFNRNYQLIEVDN